MVNPVSINEALIIIDSVPRALVYSITLRENQNMSLIVNETLTEEDVENNKIIYPFRNLLSNTFYTTEVQITAEPSNEISLRSKILSSTFFTGNTFIMKAQLLSAYAFRCCHTKLLGREKA